MNKNLLLSASVALALIFSFIAVVTPGTPGQDGQNGRDGVGGSAGPEKFTTQFFRTGFTVGGDNTHVATTSDASTYTLTSAEINTDISYVEWNAGASITLTTPASTTAPFSGLAIGESFEQIWYSSTSTTATTITFSAGTGVDLQEDEGGTVVINGLETARVSYIKQTSGDIAVIVEPYQVGD